MKRVKQILAIGLIFQGGMLWGQEIDQSKMDRDLQISEDIVKSLFKSAGGEGHFYSVNPRASYLEGYGVIINLNSPGYFYSSNFGNSFDFSFGDSFEFDFSSLEDLKIDAEKIARDAERAARDAEMLNRDSERMAREMEREAREMQRLQREEPREQKERRGRGSTVIISPNPDVNVYFDDGDGSVIVSSSHNSVDPEKWKEIFKDVATTFFSDYADLIGQLKNEEKIMLVSGSSHSHAGYVFSYSSINKQKLTAEANRSDIAAFKTGKLSREKFKSAIRFAESKKDAEKKTDLELIASIFQRLYKSDLATTYYTSSRVSYERLENFGVIYKMKVYSSTSSSRDGYRIVTQDKSGLSRAERDKIVNGMYPQFEKELKENMLNYGKTIKSLSSAETLMFQVRLTECKGCDMPEQIAVSVKQSVLTSYSTGKLSKENAMKKINVKKS